MPHPWEEAQGARVPEMLRQKGHGRKRASDSFGSWEEVPGLRVE